MSVGSYPPSYVRWIISTIICPLDHIHKAYVAAYPKDAKLFVATDDNAMLELIKKEWPAGEWAIIRGSTVDQVSGLQVQPL
jgi:hypothetical protein